MKGSSPIPHVQVALLGMITIAVYGSWAYSFGVLLDPIVADTGWPEVGVVATFSASAAIAGAGSIVGGWILDRWGSRPVLGIAAIAGTGIFLLAANAGTFAVFAVFAALGGGVFGALGFYHITQTVAARVSGPAAVRSIAAVTVWGAFAGTIYLPMAGWLIEVEGWRLALTDMTVSAGILLAIGAIFLNTDPSPTERIRFLQGIRRSLQVPGAPRFMLAVALAGIAISVLVVYQVPLMIAAGLSLGTASLFAGLRSMAQLTGRLPLAPIVGRLGDHLSLQLAFAAIAAGCLIVIVAGTPTLAVVFALVAGFGIGAMSPLVGIHSVSIFPDAILGVGRGAVAAAGSAASAVGPLLGSSAVAVTGSRTAAAIVGAVAALGAILAMRLGVDRSDAPTQSSPRNDVGSYSEGTS